MTNVEVIKPEPILEWGPLSLIRGILMGDEDLRKKLNDMHEKLIALHVVICGHDGLGGLQREFAEVKKEIEEVKAFRVKVATISSMIGAACGAAVTWVAAWIKSKQ